MEEKKTVRLVLTTMKVLFTGMTRLTILGWKLDLYHSGTCNKWLKNDTMVGPVINLFGWFVNSSMNTFSQHARTFISLLKPVLSYLIPANQIDVLSYTYHESWNSIPLRKTGHTSKRPPTLRTFCNNGPKQYPHMRISFSQANSFRHDSYWQRVQVHTSSSYNMPSSHNRLLLRA